MTYDYINTHDRSIISGPHGAQDTYIKRLTSCGNPEVLLAAGPYDLPDGARLVPRVYPPLTDGQRYGGEPIVYADRVEMGVEAIPVPTAEELAAETQAWREMAEVTPRQARLMLKRAGLLNGIKAVINGLDEEAQIEWEYATTFKRTHPLLLAVAAQAGLTAEQLDTMFRDAAGL